ncbi:MAG TPA: ABC transporter ATP-binding protein [Candidatus Scatomonas merdigallinarum]|nr:ABC transporter ATP-binding protein [Candidatus Scatomonas merdigallinarum]
METMIEVIDLVKKYQDQEVLKKISCTFEKGKIAGLIGRNGAGKTVLMKCICGFVIPTEGEIRIDGRKLRGRKEADLTKIGMIIENPAFLEAYTGYQNLAFLARINGIIGKEKIRKTLRMVGLDPDSRKKVGKYSMGMRQRLALAQAVMEDQEILILDEPMNGLDNRGVEEMRKLLLEFRGQGKTILLASHSQEDIRVLCDKIYEMDQGEIIGTQWKNQEGSE